MQPGYFISFVSRIVLLNDSPLVFIFIMVDRIMSAKITLLKFDCSVDKDMHFSIPPSLSSDAFYAMDFMYLVRASAYLGHFDFDDFIVKVQRY